MRETRVRQRMLDSVRARAASDRSRRAPIQKGAASAQSERDLLLFKRARVQIEAALLRIELALCRCGCNPAQCELELLQCELALVQIGLALVQIEAEMVQIEAEMAQITLTVYGKRSTHFPMSGR